MDENDDEVLLRQTSKQELREMKEIYSKLL